MRTIYELFTKYFRPGDIYTHMYGGNRGEQDPGTKGPSAAMIEGRKRGVIFDVGHGGTSFRYSTAVPLMKAGFVPDSISTDLHTGSMNNAMKDMLNVMGKFMAMGMSLERRHPALDGQSGEGDSAAAARAARRRRARRHLGDALEKGTFGYVDPRGGRIDGTAAAVVRDDGAGRQSGLRPQRPDGRALGEARPGRTRRRPALGQHPRALSSRLPATAAAARRAQYRRARSAPHRAALSGGSPERAALFARAPTGLRRNSTATAAAGSHVVVTRRLIGDRHVEHRTSGTRALESPQSSPADSPHEHLRRRQSVVRAGRGELARQCASHRAGGSAPALAAEANVYKAIGVRPLINCRGTLTVIGGSVELPEVRAAKMAANQQYVQIDELMAAVGARLAELTGAEWGMVSSGCAAAMSHATAACVAGGNPDLHVRIPEPRRLRERRGDHPHPFAQRLRRRDPRGRREDRRGRDTRGAAAGDRTEDGDDLHLRRQSERDGPDVHGSDRRNRPKPHRVPVLVDAAAEILTIPNIHLQRGATLVAYSGGKFIRGPQSAGLLLGRKDLVQAAWVHSAPHHGYARAMKVGREEVVGMLVAVESWVKRDHDAEWKQWVARCEHIAARVSKIAGVTATVQKEPGGRSNRSPRLTIRWELGGAGHHRRRGLADPGLDRAAHRPRWRWTAADADEAGTPRRPPATPASRLARR